MRVDIDMRTAINGLVLIVMTLTVSVCADVWTQTASASTITVPNDHLIIPGVRIGPFVLGMTETQLLAMGQPSSRGAVSLIKWSGGQLASGQASAVPVTMYCYNDEAVCVEVNQVTHLVHWNGSQWSHGIRSSPDENVLARQIVAAQGSACQ